MKRSIEKLVYAAAFAAFIISLAAIFLTVSSCSKDDPLRLVGEGYLRFSGSTPGKGSKVPDCTNKEPELIYFGIADLNGVNRSATSPVVIEGGSVTQIDGIALPEGRYTVNEISLVKGSETLYSMPEISESEFTPFVKRTVPFGIIITPGGMEVIDGGLFCIDNQLLPIPVSVAGYLHVYEQEVQAAYFEIFPGNHIEIDFVEVFINGDQVYNISIGQDGIYRIVIPEEFELMEVSALRGGAILETVTITEYNTDDFITWNDDVIRFYSFLN